MKYPLQLTEWIFHSIQTKNKKVRKFLNLKMKLEQICWCMVDSILYLKLPDFGKVVVRWNKVGEEVSALWHETLPVTSHWWWWWKEHWKQNCEMEDIKVHVFLEDFFVPPDFHSLATTNIKLPDLMMREVWALWDLFELGRNLLMVDSISYSKLPFTCL